MRYADDIFSILGVDIPILVGRKKLMKEVITHLEKDNPEHLSFIGSKYIGKTVFLAAVDKYLKEDDSKYLFSVYWDLHHNLPKDDKNFFQLLTFQILDQIREKCPEYLEVLDAESEHPYYQVKALCELMNDENQSFILILDGIDDLLKSSNISRNLWDNLRSIAQLRSLKILTGSRKRLRELCSSPESKTSDFWGIFYPSPKIIGPFIKEDIDSVFSLLNNKRISLDQGATSEFVNWTGGHPLLVALLTRKILDSTKQGVTLSHEHINDLALEIYPSDYQDHIEALWDDCTLEEQGLLSDHAINGECVIQPEFRKICEVLKSKGFFTQDNNKTKLTSRFIKQIADEKSKQITNLRLAFGNGELYLKNVKTFLELRYSQIKISNSDLSDRLEHIINDVLKPLVCMTQFRGLADYLIDEVIHIEFPNNEIPSEYTSQWEAEWNRKGKVGPRPFESPISFDRGIRLALLRRSAESKFLKKFSSSTIAGLESLHRIGNYGQHMGNSTITKELVIPYVLLAIEVSSQFSIESK